MHLGELFGRVGPILGFLVCITVVAELADKIGLFDVLAREAARLARGSVLALWLLVVLVGSISSAVLSLDTTAVLITPVVLVLARQLGLNLALFAFTAVWLANTASLLLPVSNLTNLLAWSRLGGDVGRFASVMWPAAASALVITVAVTAFLFRSSLRGRYQDPPPVEIADRFLFVLAAVVCAGLGPAFALGVNVVVAAGTGAVLLVIGCLIRNRSFLSWRLLPWQLVVGVSVLFVRRPVRPGARSVHAARSCRRSRRRMARPAPAVRDRRSQRQPGRQPARLSRHRAAGHLTAADRGPADRRERRTADPALGQSGHAALGRPLPLSRRRRSIGGLSPGGG